MPDTSVMKGCINLNKGLQYVNGLCHIHPDSKCGCPDQKSDDSIDSSFSNCAISNLLWIARLPESFLARTSMSPASSSQCRTETSFISLTSSYRSCRLAASFTVSAVSPSTAAPGITLSTSFVESVASCIAPCRCISVLKSCQCSKSSAFLYHRACCISSRRPLRLSCALHLWKSMATYVPMQPAASPWQRIIGAARQDVSAD
mmetsp:Transcript_83434/g.232995  ORF Transcript_83434/g.232995 Transcript_83434/m.232995 type:complete len:203 (+) Transcript_83434:969-1577(+)